MSDIGLYEKRIFHCALLGKPFPAAPAPQGEYKMSLALVSYDCLWKDLVDRISPFLFNLKRDLSFLLFLEH